MWRPELSRELGGLGAVALLALSAPIGAQQRDQQEIQQGARNAASSQPGELGKVRWWRDEAAAKARAAATGAPLLVLFQEVPG